MNTTADSFLAALKGLDCRAIEGLSLSVEGAKHSIQDARKWFEARCGEGATGWAQFSGINVWVDAGKSNPAPDGILLAAELHVDNGNGGVSHHLRHDGETWIATMITQTEKDGTFLESRSFLHKDERTKLTYEVAWEPDETGALRPVAFRFISKSSD